MVMVDALAHPRDAREVDDPARAAVSRGLGHEHQDRVGADIKRANLHGGPCSNDDAAGSAIAQAAANSSIAASARAAMSSFFWFFCFFCLPRKRVSSSGISP